MNETWYLIAAVAVAGLITLGLRALPFAALKPLRKSRFVQRLGQWMPAGILLILAVVIFRGQLVEQPDHAWAAVAALAVTIAVHLLSKRRTLVSIAAGTACYVLLINLF